jgi:shikimate kinase
MVPEILDSSAIADALTGMGPLYFTFHSNPEAILTRNHFSKKHANANQRYGGFT